MKEERDFYDVPVYIEKAIKKLSKQKEVVAELNLQISDYMETHGIPKDTPLYLLKHFDDEVDPNQIQMDLE